MIVLILSGAHKGKIGTMDVREITDNVMIRLASGESVYESRKNTISIGTENHLFYEGKNK